MKRWFEIALCLVLLPIALIGIGLIFAGMAIMRVINPVLDRAGLQDLDVRGVTWRE